MTFYRVHYRVEGGNSGGFSWHTSLKEAADAATEAARSEPDEYADGPPEVDDFDFKPTKKGLLKILNTYASYPDNG